MQDLTGKSTGSSLTAAEWNQLPQEVQNIITDLGIALSGGDTDQLGKAMARFIGTGDYYTCTGAAGAYVLTKLGTQQAPAAYSDGLTIRFRPNHNNPGASTVNVNGLGVVDLKREDGTALVAGDLNTGHDCAAHYDASSGDFFVYYWSMISQGPGAEVPRGYIDGFILSRDSGDPGNDINIAAGVCRDDLNLFSIESSSEFTKQSDANWSEGDDAGGFPSGLVIADGFYHVFVIAKTDGTVDGGFDNVLNAANLLADATAYTYYRRVGTLRRSGGAWSDFTQNGDEFTLSSVVDQNATLINASAHLETITVPSGISVQAIINVIMDDNNGNALANIYSPYGNNGAPSSVNGRANLRGGLSSGSHEMATQYIIRTNTSAQIGYISDITPTAFEIGVVGWIDARGKDA